MATVIDHRLHRDPDVLGTALPGQERGRGARSNASGRFERHSRLFADDGWQALEDLPKLLTAVIEERPKSIITRNDSPDISFDQSINPYQGCEHGCAYCYARPSHAFWGLSPGLDFETRLFAKTNAADLLRRELSDRRYVPKVIALGANTDPYQPIERQYRITRQILEVLSEFNHPVGIVTKSALVLRDLDILASMAERNLVRVALSVTTLDARLSRSLEPRASAPHRRLAALERLNEAGIPTTVMVAPIIPSLNDHEIERILEACAVAGVRQAGYVLIRLPREVAEIFEEWLASEVPDRAQRVMSLIRSMRGGKNYDSAWGTRQRGTGPYAWTIGRRFEIACRKLGLNRERRRLDTNLFTRPPQPGDQLPLL